MAERAAQARARYVALLQRAAFDVRLALALNLAPKLPYARRARLVRAQRELQAEARERWQPGAAGPLCGRERQSSAHGAQIAPGVVN